MQKKAKLKSAEKAYAAGTDYQFATQEIPLGPWTSFSYRDDPKHMCFVLARYKFCAKMLEGYKTVMEVGSGDGFGLPIMSQACRKIYAADWDARLLEGNARRLAHLKNVEYLHVDLNKGSTPVKVDAIYMIDVIEHLEPKKEALFMGNVVRCLTADGVLIIGTPNITASQYATPRSAVQHINLKSQKTLKALGEKYFKHVFMFGMNDEVVHTGYAPMCHYIWAVCAGVRSKGR